MKLKGHTAIISGANQGFGLAVAKAFIKEGANVAICARNAELLAKAQLELQQLTDNPDAIFAMTADVTDPQQMEKLATAAVSTFGRIDSLIANAGVHGPKGPIESVDWDDWSRAVDINLKGVVLQCRAVLPYFKNQGRGKIILLSGGGATKPMPFLSAYAASKAAVVRFGETLAHEVQSFHIDVNAVGPGALNTRLLDDVLAAGPEKVGETFYQQAVKQKQEGGQPLALGANLCVFLASKASDGITGKLISAIWDPWADLPTYLATLQNSDIYTLRRIIPQERGQDWGNP